MPVGRNEIAHTEAVPSSPGSSTVAPARSCAERACRAPPRAERPPPRSTRAADPSGDVGHRSERKATCVGLFVMTLSLIVPPGRCCASIESTLSAGPALRAHTRTLTGGAEIRVVQAKQESPCHLAAPACPDGGGYGSLELPAGCEAARSVWAARICRQGGTWPGRVLMDRLSILR
jgi:hypothetical protein